MNSLIKMAVLGGIAAGALMVTSCSDDEKDYPANVYFTGPVSPVNVVSAAGSNASIGAPSFNITFDAAGDWNVTTHNYLNPQETATWLSFFTTAGDEGSYMLGVYAEPNTGSAERAATVEVNCQGQSVSFLVIQPSATPAGNPNAAAIDAHKTVSKIEYLDNAGDISFSYAFTYSNSVLSSVAYSKTIDETKSDVTTYDITSNASATANGISVNKVVVNDQTFAVINGKTVIGYPCTSVSLGNNVTPYNFTYNNDLNLTALSGNGYNVTLGWTNGNLTSENYSDAAVESNLSASYASVANDANLDLNWFIGLYTPGYGLNDPARVLGAMNLLGKRSANLAVTVGTNNMTYANGIPVTVDGETQTLPGFTVTCSTGDIKTIKVYYAE